jgi:hypothetical protein
MFRSALVLLIPRLLSGSDLVATAKDPSGCLDGLHFDLHFEQRFVILHGLGKLDLFFGKLDDLGCDPPKERLEFVNLGLIRVLGLSDPVENVLVVFHHGLAPLGQVSNRFLDFN